VFGVANAQVCRTLAEFESDGDGLTQSHGSRTATMCAVPFDTPKFDRHPEVSWLAISRATGAAEASRLP